jgi:hypothetical protein
MQERPETVKVSASASADAEVRWREIFFQEIAQRSCYSTQMEIHFDVSSRNEAVCDTRHIVEVQSRAQCRIHAHAMYERIDPQLSQLEVLSEVEQSNRVVGTVREVHVA